MLRGFLKANEDAESRPAYAIGSHESASPRSPFREIVGICYEAMDAKFVDPERALKAYVSWKERQRTAGRKAVRIEGATRRRRVRPKRVRAVGTQKT